jgi:DNA polymerase III alpha subunit (gram-positive type)
MLEWIKNINKELPNWKTYLAKFDKNRIMYVVISTETTGMNPEKDVILSIGAFAVNDSIFIGTVSKLFYYNINTYMIIDFQMSLLSKVR